VLSQQTFAEVRAEKTCTTGDQNSLAHDNRFLFT
jgi:hypothetical protein